MKRLTWTMAATALLFAPACGDKSDPAADTSSSSSDGTTGDTDSGTTTSATASASDTNNTSDSTSSTTGNTTDTTTDSNSTTASGGTTTMGFIDPPDGGVVGQCDPGLQDCMGMDEKCTGYVTMPGDCCVDANHCVPVTGNKQFGEECTRVDGDDDCAAGLFCMTKTSGSTGMGVCLEYCVVGDDSTCENGGTCNGFNDGALPMCQEACDPLIQDCTPPQGCFAAFDGFVCANPNLDEGGGDGDPCYTIQSCQPGLVCVSADFLDGCNDTACCTPWCDLNEPDPCTGSESCEAWYAMGEAPPGHDDVGACTIPQ